jgi:alcohol dehydrogenase class IV
LCPHQSAAKEITVSARTFVVPPVDTVTFGDGAFDTIDDLVTRHGGNRVLAVLSGSLAGTRVEAQLRERLGERLVGVYARTKQHVPRASVLEAAQLGRNGDADCVVSVGGGTPIDCAKAVTLCLGAEITRPEQFDAYRVRFTYPDRYEIPDVPQPLVPHIAVPTTLSGGEHTGLFGVTDELTKSKHSYTNPGFAPKSVVLDPAVTALTPGWLWAASGMRAVDHAVEGILSARHMPFADALATEALRLLSENLPLSVKDASDGEARTNCLLGTWLSIFALTNVGIGLSHGIGHQLAAEFDLIHGVTSAIMLPLVMEFNANHTRPQLRRIAEAFGHQVGDLDDEQATALAIESVRELIQRLEVPNRISAVGGKREALPKIAAHVMADPAVAASPRPVSKDDILALLAAAW